MSLPKSNKFSRDLKWFGRRMILHSIYWTSLSGRPSLYLPGFRSGMSLARPIACAPFLTAMSPSFFAQCQLCLARALTEVDSFRNALKWIEYGDQRDGYKHCQEQQRQADLDVIVEGVATRFHHQHIHRRRHGRHVSSATGDRHRHGKRLWRDV